MDSKDRALKLEWKFQLKEWEQDEWKSLDKLLKSSVTNLEKKLKGGSNGPAMGASESLNRYWLVGAGLARWADTGTPYRSLVAALRSEGVPGRMVHGLAARYYHAHFGVWPGRRGKKK